MAKFRGFEVWPYSGWPRQVWGQGGSANDRQDADAAARSARPVVESANVSNKKAPADRRLISRDLDGHQGQPSWKAFNRKGVRTGTWNRDLTTRLGK